MFTSKPVTVEEYQHIKASEKFLRIAYIVWVVVFVTLFTCIDVSELVMNYLLDK